MAQQKPTGRANQKLRTRNAVVQATVDLIRTAREVTMPEIARTALVSEATAYRYFPDLTSLLQEAMKGQMPTPEQALESVADSRDPVQRVAVATESLLRHVSTYQGAVRAMIASTITSPGRADARPKLRLGLIEHALDPAATGTLGRAALAQLKYDLAIVVSAEAFFTLTDICHLSTEEAIQSAVHTATTLTRAALPEP
jgi:AcrR family transcriptional regulator